MTRKILYLSPYFWPEEIGSAPYCSELAVWLHERNYDVHIVAFRPHYPSIDKFQDWADGARDEETYKGMRVTRVGVNERGQGGIKTRLKNDIGFLWHVCCRAVRGDFKGTETIVAYVPSILTLYAARFVRLLTGASIVGVVHDIESGLAMSLGMTKNTALLGFMRLVEYIGLNFAAQIVVLTDGMREELKQIGCRRPITTLPIWASVPAFKPIEVAATPTLMYSGNFGKKQNLDQLLPLFKRLSDEKQNIKIHMRGDGSEKNRLQQKMTDTQISNVAFLPLAPADEFLEVLQAAAIHLVPQALNVANYALPSKLFSIMAAGRPFICIAESGSPLDRLARDSGAGLCIAPGDEQELYDTVVALAQDGDRQTSMGRQGQKFVGEHMDKNKILSAYQNLIDSR